jgi:hypothetical protein
MGLFAWPWIAYLQTGKLRVGGSSVSRRTRPVLFWAGVGATAAVLAVLLGLFVRIAFFDE